MLLTRVSITNFRGIPRLALGLDNTSVVIGENNHGKTSLLDVLQRCLGAPEDGEKPGWEYRDFRRGPDGVVGPIRVVLGFEAGDGDADPTLADPLFAAATVQGPDGVPRLRAEFTGDPATGAMAARFVDDEGVPLQVPDPEAALQHLRELHPVVVVRLAEPAEDGGLEWVTHEDQLDFDPLSGDDPEEVITQVYHRLTRTRGAIPPEEIRRGIQAVWHLRADLEDGGQGGVVGRVGPVGGLLDRFLSAAAAEGPAQRAGSGSRSLGLLLVLGSLLEARSASGALAGSSPIIAIEEPEVHLHPMLLSSTWDVIQGLRAQTLVTTNSGEFLSQVPIQDLRRLVRRSDRIEAFRLREGTLTPDALRRVTYHVRAKRGVTLFARCWLLVEGETEFWLLQELARVLGYDLGGEGVRCVEFAQCGVAPLVRLANDLGIEWHLLSDGDDAGVAFAADASAQLSKRRRRDHVTRLERRNIEMLLWDHGYQDVFMQAAGLPVPGPGTPAAEEHPNPRRVVERAVRAHSKPYLALQVAEECARRGPAGVPEPLRRVIETCVRLARAAVSDGFGAERGRS
ncbi:MAG: ATP-dependent nuclease [Longimicrobiales bacterium]